VFHNRFLAVHAVERPRCSCGHTARFVEDEELGLGAEHRRVRQPGGRQVFSRRACEMPARDSRLVGFLRAGLGDGLQVRLKRRVLAERIDERRAGIGHRQHVAGLDALPPAGSRNRQIPKPSRTLPRSGSAHRHREMLPRAETCPQTFAVHHLHAPLPRHLNHTLRLCTHILLILLFDEGSHRRDDSNRLEFAGPGGRVRLQIVYPSFSVFPPDPDRQFPTSSETPQAQHRFSQ